MLQFFRRCFCFFSTKNDTIPLLKDTAPWTPPIKEGFVIKVYDADTITVASKLPYNNSPIYRWSVRIKGIDAPELKSKNSKLAELALQGKEELSEKKVDEDPSIEEDLNTPNKRESSYNKMAEREMMGSLAKNPFMDNNTYARDICIQDDFLKPINTTTTEYKPTQK